MGLFGNVFGGNKSKNYAKLYMDAVHEVNPDKAHKIFMEWGKQSGCEDDANYLMTVVYYGAIVETSKDDLEQMLKIISVSRPADPSLEDAFKSNLTIALIGKGYSDLAEKYVL